MGSWGDVGYKGRIISWDPRGRNSPFTGRDRPVPLRGISRIKTGDWEGRRIVRWGFR